MLLKDYYILRSCPKYKGLSLTKTERSAFGVKDKESGWHKRSEDTEIPDTLICDTITQVLVYQSVTPRIRGKLRNILRSLEICKLK